ncbi:MAG: hypothetical protein R2736_23345 [Solirubrobacterales bacterium]
MSYPKMVLHAASYGLGHVSTARFWHDLRRGDRHWTVSDTGWAKAAWGGLFGQCFDAPRSCRSRSASPTPTILDIVLKGGSSFCAPPTYRLLDEPTSPSTTSASCATAPAPASR